ncbi:MAG TPA: ATP-binding protein [Balneolaceae bacterium]|nr:ATP-binding protein [Balneolaceae bacterium]
MSIKSRLSDYNHLLFLGIILASFGVFLIDTQFPLGVTGDIPYALFVMATYWNKKKSYTIAAGIVTTLLIITGFLLNGNSDYVIMSATIRGMSIILIWGTVWFVINYKSSLHNLRKNEQRISAIFQAETDEILVFQLDDNMIPLLFLEVNKAACDILGYNRNELLQKTLYDITPVDNQKIDHQIEKLVSMGTLLYETQHVTRENEKIPLEISARSFTYDGRLTIILIGRDIRERRKLEQEILNVSEQERQRIGQDMHDELGQLLTGIGLITQNIANELKQEKTDMAQKMLGVVDLVKEADEHTRALTRGLIPVNIEPNGLDTAIQELIKTLSNMYDVDIRYLNEENIELADNTSAVHMYRIIQEALNNAIKHGNPTSITIKLFTNIDHIMLSIRDNGKGFSTPVNASEGMGLRIMNFRAQIMEGNLEIKSKIGEGTEVICKIPHD